ncbi:uncharacterized protein O3C94_019782 [Discoglossus pictus]
MDTLEKCLTGHEDDLFTFSAPELEEFVQILSDKVQADKEQLEKLNRDIVTLEAVTAERNSEKEFYVSLMAKTVDLESVLSAEAKTQEQLLTVTQELDRLVELVNSRGAAGDLGLEKLEADSDTVIASFDQKEKQLREEREQLGELLQKTQAALTDAQLKKHRADEELLTLQQQLGSSKCKRQSEADKLLEACIKDMGLLNILPDPKHNQK